MSGGNGFPFWRKLRLVAPSQYEGMHAMRPASVCADSHVALTGGLCSTSLPLLSLELHQIACVTVTKQCKLNALPSKIWTLNGIITGRSSSEKWVARNVMICVLFPVGAEILLTVWFRPNMRHNKPLLQSYRGFIPKGSLGRSVRLRTNRYWTPVLQIRSVVSKPLLQLHVLVPRHRLDSHHFVLISPE